MSINTIQVTPSAYNYPLLIKQLLHTPMATARNQEIVYADKMRYTYDDFFKRINRLGNALNSIEVEYGDTVAVMDWDSHRYLECFFAIPMLGAVLQTVNIRLSPQQILYTLNHTGAGVILVNLEFMPLLEQISSQLTSAKKFVLLSDADPTPPAGFVGEYETLLGTATDHFNFPDFDENTRATTFYTTGTTGDPKGVYFSHRQLVLHTLATSSALALSPKLGSFHRDDVYMPITPMFHVHAWGMPYVATMAGVKQVYPGRYQPEAVLKLIETEKVTFSHCVPTILHMLLTATNSRDVDLSGWKVIIGGSALTKGLAESALERGIDVFSGYGMSETCPILTLSQVTNENLTETEGNVNIRIKAGRPVPLVAMQVVSASMEVLPNDGTSLGEVVVRAPWLTQGYLKNAEASEVLWKGGWLHTQDVGKVDSQGYLQLKDRIKDVIKTGGEWISSIELEDIISSHTAVNEVAVIGVASEKWGERPLALIVLKAAFVGRISEEEIRNHVHGFVEMGRISKVAIPERIQFVQSLPRTSVGKLNKRAMREQFGTSTS